MREEPDEHDGLDEKIPWTNVLKKVNYRNIHLFQGNSTMKKRLTRTNVFSLVESIARAYSGQTTRVQLTGKFEEIDKTT